MIDELSQGTMRCDICGLATPHGHDSETVEIERFIRPAFEKTTVPMRAFGRIAHKPVVPYSDNETERLWQHFISGWFMSKKFISSIQPSDSTLREAKLAGMRRMQEALQRLAQKFKQDASFCRREEAFEADQTYRTCASQIEAVLKQIDPESLIEKP